MKRAANFVRRMARDFVLFWGIRIPSIVTRIAASLPSSREMQDGALYACAFVGVVLLASGVLS